MGPRLFGSVDRRRLQTRAPDWREWGAIVSTNPNDRSDDRRQSAGRDEGRRRRDAARARLRAHRARFILRGRRALLFRLLDVGAGTIDDVRLVVVLPPGLNPKLFGCVPDDLAEARIIERVGFTASTRPAAHARPVSVWRLVDRAAAEAWLVANPDVPDDADEPRPDDRTE